MKHEKYYVYIAISNSVRNTILDSCSNYAFVLDALYLLFTWNFSSITYKALLPQKEKAVLSFKLC